MSSRSCQLTFYAKAVTTLLLTLFGTSFTLAKPNVLFISVDDMNDWVGFLEGHPQVKTPNMDRLAKRGVVFSNAHCAAPLCGPSRAAIFSGKQPFNTKVYNNQQQIRKLNPDLQLLPQYFHENGYRTLGAGKLMHRKFEDLYDEVFFTEQRWSPYADKEPQSEASRSGLLARPLNGMPNDRQRLQPGNFSSFDWGPVKASGDEMGDGKVSQWASKRLSEKEKQGQPFFLAVGYYRPHIPLYAPKEYFDLYPAESTTLPEVLDDDIKDLGPEALALAHSIQTAGLHKNVMKQNQWKEAVAAYLACISYVDAQIGKLLEALDKGPNAENTVIVLWSDHGWHLGEKEHWGKTTGWERSTRVPLIIVPAKSESRNFQLGTQCKQPVGLIDLFPTLVEQCGLEPKQNLDGQSLVSLLENPTQETGRSIITTIDKGIYSVRDSRWRLIRYSDGTEELYDHLNDPNEWNNLALNEKHTWVVEKLSQVMPQ